MKYEPIHIYTLSILSLGFLTTQSYVTLQMSYTAHERPERSRNATAQARHRAKRKAYIEQVNSLSLAKLFRFC